VPATLATDLTHRLPAFSAPEEPREQVPRVGLHVAALLPYEALLAATLRPRPIDFLPSCGDSFPGVLWDDAQLLALHNVPLALTLDELALASGAGIPPGLGPVPAPPADVLLILQDAADRRGGPGTTRRPTTRNLLLVQLLHQSGDRLARGKLTEEAEHN